MIATSGTPSKACPSETPRPRKRSTSVSATIAIAGTSSTCGATASATRGARQPRARSRQRPSRAITDQAQLIAVVYFQPFEVGRQLLLGHHLLAYHDMLTRDRERYADCLRRTHQPWQHSAATPAQPSAVVLTPAHSPAGRIPLRRGDAALLRLLLEELRQFGVHERLDEVITRYLEAETVPELLALILARCESDYETEQRGLVRDALCHLWAARRGLAESLLPEPRQADVRA